MDRLHGDRVTQKKARIDSILQLERTTIKVSLALE